MATLYDYLNWRGDLTFSEVPCNEVDYLIFALICYIDFEGIIPPEHQTDGIPLKAAANSFFSRNPDIKKTKLGLIVPKEIIKLFKAVKDTRRFRSVGMKAYVNVIDLEKEMQFSAITFLPGNGSAIAAYRGTDDTIIGWKENFNMSFLEEVPAQKAAKDYLQTVSECHNGALDVAGHSKGGNLAIYAAVKSSKDIRGRIGSVWNFDGPGFASDLFHSDTYLSLRPVIHNIVPQASVVGQLLRHDEKPTVIKSRQLGLFQHDALSWEIMGGNIVRFKGLKQETVRSNQVFNGWVLDMSKEQREQFVECVYQLLSGSDALTLTDLVSAKNLFSKKNKKLDPEVSRLMQRMVNELIELNTKDIMRNIIPKKEK